MIHLKMSISFLLVRKFAQFVYKSKTLRMVLESNIIFFIEYDIDSLPEDDSVIENTIIPNMVLSPQKLIA